MAGAECWNMRVRCIIKLNRLIAKENMVAVYLLSTFHLLTD
jgi:hypothetical protein